MKNETWLRVTLCMAAALLAANLFATVAVGQSQSPTPSSIPPAPKADKQDDPTEASLVEPVRTESPRQTIRTFNRLTEELEVAVLAYRRFRTSLNFNRIRILEPQFKELIDLSEIPKASRRKVAIDTTIFLLDILGRVDLPSLQDVPDAEAFDDKDEAQWRVPGTPLRIVRLDSGPREGEFLFSARTPDIAQVFFRRISHLPLRSKIGVRNWHEFRLQMTGPMFPVSLQRALPDELTETWLDTPIWKIVAVFLVAVFALGLVLLWHRTARRFRGKNRSARLLRRSLTPLIIIGLVLAFSAFITLQINITGQFASIIDSVMTVVIYVAAIWALWLLLLMTFEWIIQSPKIKDDSLDADLLRLIARVLAISGAVLLLAIAGQDLGLPVFSILAGLGLGGLAVALAIRPTLENLISGVILYIDRPVKIGDYCGFGEYTGFVEHIGMRTTRLRTLDRTLVSVPNSVFADKEINNWAHCDRMQIRTTIGLRYETNPDQLRYALTKLREMFHAHPQIHPNTVRVRFVGYGESSLNIEIRVSLTREWNDFYAIREDVLLRTSEIVRDSGTGFAFPSQTVYWTRDDGLDADDVQATTEAVQAWRESGCLPFPQFSVEQIDQLRGTLDYPPVGSPHAQRQAAEDAPVNEPLSKAPESEGTNTVT